MLIYCRQKAVTLGSMRRHGVRGLFVTCQHGGHEHAAMMTTGLTAPAAVAAAT
jgi:hypothetical protein